MPWVATRAVSAQMVKIESWWYWPKNPFVHYTVGLGVPATEPHCAVPVPIGFRIRPAGLLAKNGANNKDFWLMLDDHGKDRSW